MAKSNYNAETAWNYLGAGSFDGRGAYDYSSLPKYQRIFEVIEQEPLRKQPSFSEDDILSASVGRYANARSALSNLGDSDLMQQLLGGSLTNIASSFTNYPQTAFQNAMAGKYRGFI